MRTIRTKVYQFSELSKAGQKKAILNIWFVEYYSEDRDIVLDTDLKKEIVEMIEKGKYEFKADGTRF